MAASSPQSELPQSPGGYDISPEGDKSDNRSYQVPADIADNEFTDNTTLRAGTRRARTTTGRRPCTRINVKRLLGGLVFKAHILLYHSTLGLRVIKRESLQVCVGQEQLRDDAAALRRGARPGDHGPDAPRDGRGRCLNPEPYVYIYIYIYIYMHPAP